MKVVGLKSFVEEKKSTTTLSVKKDQVGSLRAVNDIERYSSLMKLLNVTAWVRRAINNFRKMLSMNACITINLTAEEIKRAEMDWVKTTQCEVKEQDNFKQSVQKLGLVEKDGNLRCTGRLGNSDLDIDGREKLLLPKQHKLNHLIIEACHQKVHHCGVRSTLAELRSRFWVPKGRQIVKKILSHFVTCKKLLGKPYREPATAALPEFRVTRAPPFSRVGKILQHRFMLRRPLVK